MSLKVVVEVVQIISLPVAALSILLAHRSSKNAREIELELHLAEDFRAHWEGGWRETLNGIRNDPHLVEGGELGRVRQTKRTKSPAPSPGDDLSNMLNWLDWVGSLMRSGRIPHRMATLATLQPQLRAIIEAGQAEVESDTAKEGPDFWGGLNYLAQTLDLKRRTAGSQLDPGAAPPTQ